MARFVHSIQTVALRCLLPVLACAPLTAMGGAWFFTDDTVNAGLFFLHEYNTSDENEISVAIAGGLGIGDLNDDGWDDIFAATGRTLDSGGANLNPNKLFISNGDGTYTESAAAWGIGDTDTYVSAPLFADLNGDGLLDLLLGSMFDQTSHLYLNTGASTLTDASAGSGLPMSSINLGYSAADVTGDGYLDLFATHWRDTNFDLLFINNGSGQFADQGASLLDGGFLQYTFTSIFAHVDGNNRLDLLVASDFQESQYFLQNPSGFLERQDSTPLTDYNGMGGALGDYDNDGDFDWFVTSIDYTMYPDFDGDPETTGNRLYRNDGNGNFTDVSTAAGVRPGFWGWGACFADFNNDGHLDIFHVNGVSFAEPVWVDDPAVMFISNGAGGFTESALQLGLADIGIAKSILCFDNDHDGDIDILVQNTNSSSVFYRNNLDENHYLQVRLQQVPPNAGAIGAVIRITAGGVNQMRQVLAGGNYGSGHPLMQHFGLGSETTVSRVEVTWPDGQVSEYEDVAADQILDITNPYVPPIIKQGFE